MQMSPAEGLSLQEFSTILINRCGLHQIKVFSVFTGLQFAEPPSCGTDVLEFRSGITLDMATYLSQHKVAESMSEDHPSKIQTLPSGRLGKCTSCTESVSPPKERWKQMQNEVNTWLPRYLREHRFVPEHQTCNFVNDRFWSNSTKLLREMGPWEGLNGTARPMHSIASLTGMLQ